MYNSEKTIRKALESVLHQTYEGGVEVIVVNDGSSDLSQEIVESIIVEYPDKDLRLISQINQGVSRARNVGLKVASGDYITFLDSDDVWRLNKLSRQVAAIEELNVDFLCALRNNDKIGFPYQLKGNYAIITLKRLLIRVIGQTSTAMFRRKVIDNTGFFDENQRYSEDANYWMRISINNSMVVINEQLVSTENDYAQSGLSSNLKKMEEGVQKNIKEMYGLGEINYVECLVFSVFSKLKFFKRVLFN